MGIKYYFEKGDWETGLRFLFLSADQGYELSYGNIGIILYLEKGEIVEAEKWFKKAEEADALTAPNVYQYGMLLIQEKDETKKGQYYLDKAAEDGYE